MKHKKGIHFEVSERKVLLRIMDLAMVYSGIYALNLFTDFEPEENIKIEEEFTFEIKEEPKLEEVFEGEESRNRNRERVRRDFDRRDRRDSTAVFVSLCVCIQLRRTSLNFACKRR